MMSDLASTAVQRNGAGHVRYGSKADVTLLNFDVRFTPESGHPTAISSSPLWASSTSAAAVGFAVGASAVFAAMTV